jgi:hypothetical protein
MQFRAENRWKFFPEIAPSRALPKITPGQDLAYDDRLRKCCTEPPANKVY